MKMSNELNRQQVIAELERTQSLLDKLGEINRKSQALVEERNEGDGVATEAFVKEMKRFQKAKQKIVQEKLPHVAKTDFSFPCERPKNPEDVGDPAKDIMKGVVSSVLAVAGLAFWLILLITGSKAWGVIFLSVACVLGFGIYSLVAMIPVRNILAWEQLCGEWEEQKSLWEKKMDDVARRNEKNLESFRDFDVLYLNMVKECDAFYVESTNNLIEEREKARQEILKRFDVLKEQGDALVKELDGVTVIHADLFEHAGFIATLLKTGRADTLKEAINLALEEVRKDEEERQRREEARARAEILEEQATENRLYNEAMQRAAEDQARAMKEHHAEMERAAREQAKAAELQAQAAAAANKLAQDQARAAQVRARSAEYEAREKCRGCVNSTKCSFAARQNSLSCGAYKPR